MWDSEDISRVQVVKSRTKETVQIHEMTLEQMENIEPKSWLSDLGMDNHSAMSFTTGIVRPSARGAWQYATDRADGKIEPFGREVVVHCRKSSRKVSLDPSKLEIICRTEGLIKYKATHVVVGVTFGLDAYCIFSQNLTVAKLFADELADGRSRLEPGNVPQNLHCILYSDLMDSGPSWTSRPVSNQYEACRDVLDQKGQKAVPLKV